MKNNKFINDIQKTLILITFFIGIAVVLNACTPSTNTETNTVIPKTIALDPSIIARQKNNPHSAKFEVSHEARDRAIEVAKNEQKVTEGFYIELGNTQIKVVPGFHPEHQGDSYFLDRENKILYYDDKWFDMADGHETLAKFHFSAIADAFTTMWWADTINAETGHHYAVIHNQAWKNEIIEECQFGRQAFMSLIGWPGYEKLTWEDYCHKNVNMIPPYPKEPEYN